MKIYFITNSFADAHSLKRIKTFQEAGHEVRVFGFVRNGKTSENNTDIAIGEFKDNTPYKKRIKTYIQGIKKTFSMTKGEKDVVWFFQGLDIVLFVTLINPSVKYIYEECDLVHTYISNRFVSGTLEIIDRIIIKRSYKTIMTSDGFLKYHYKGSEKPNNIVMMPNKLSPQILSLPTKKRKTFDIEHIRFAFVGAVRYRTLTSIAEIIARNYPQHEFHFYGYISPVISEQELPKRKNIFYHGRFKSPDDLPYIYSKTDMVIATYDITEANVRYAEPNKIYEAIYFRCPIIVSSGTFLAEKIQQLGIGYDVNAYKEQNVCKMVDTIEKTYSSKIKNIEAISQENAIEKDWIQKLEL